MRCTTCGADLAQNESVDYAERYFARLQVESNRVVVEPSSHSIDGSAVCKQCREPVHYEQVEFTS